MVQQTYDGHEPRGDSVAANVARWEEHEDEDEPCKNITKSVEEKEIIDIGKG